MILLGLEVCRGRLSPGFSMYRSTVDGDKEELFPHGNTVPLEFPTEPGPPGFFAGLLLEIGQDGKLFRQDFNMVV